MKQPEFVVANKVKIHRDEALELARAAEAVWVTKGKKLIQFDPAADADDDEIAKLILGRSGTLRAPPSARAGCSWWATPRKPTRRYSAESPHESDWT